MSDLRKLLLKIAGVIPALIFLTVLLIYWFSPTHSSYEPEHLLFVLNTVFLAVVPFMVSIYAAKSYMSSKSCNALMLGCGTLALGWASLIAGWLMGIPGSPNHTVTVHNTGAFLGGMFHLFSSSGLCRNRLRVMTKVSSGKTVAGIYFMIVMLLVVVTAASLAGVLPPFFIRGQGPTLLRQTVLGLAVVFYGVSAVIFSGSYLKSERYFFYWYSLALFLIAVGLVAVFLQKSVGCPVGWAGRIAQYISSFYFIVAIRQEILKAREKGLTVTKALSFLFKDSEQNYWSLLESINDGVFCFDRDGRIFLCNRQSAALLGSQREDILGCDIRDFLHSEKDKKFIDRFILAGEEAFEPDPIETVLAGKDGCSTPVEYTLSKRREGEEVMVTAVVRDISMRKRMEEDLKESERRFRRMFESHDAVMLLLDPETGMILDANHSAEEFYGYSRRKMAQMNIDQINQLPADKVKAAMSAVQGEDCNYFVFPHRLAGGEVRTVEVYSSPIGVAGRKLLFSIIHDVSDRIGAENALKKAHQELEWKVAQRTAELTAANTKLAQEIDDRRQIELEVRRRENKFRTLFENMVQGVFYQRADGSIIDTNQSALDLFGLTREQFLGRDSYDSGWKVISEDGSALRPEEHPSMVALRTGKAVRNRVLAVYNPMKRKFIWLVVNALPQFEEGRQKASQVFVTMHDITDLKSAEEALQTARDELEERVKERTLDLQKMHQQLLHAEKLSAIGNLSASIAHEFNNPLQGVLNSIKGVRRRATLDPDDFKLVDMAIGECYRMRDLIKSLQDFNRPTSGRKAPMNIHAALDSLLLLGNNVYEKKGISIIKKYDPDLPLIEGVADQIKQVLLNLLNNAVDACQQEGTISIKTAAAGKEKIVISIQDNGAGIEAGHMEHIFEPFYTTKSEVKGTGLGLSISYGIIKSHGGEISVESEPGRGSTFSVTLPVEGGTETGK